MCVDKLENYHTYCIIANVKDQSAHVYGNTHTHTHTHTGNVQLYLEQTWVQNTASYLRLHATDTLQKQNAEQIN